MSESNKEVVLRFLDAMGRGDAAAADPCITEDAYTLAKGYGKFAGVRQRDTILATIAAFKELMPEGMKPEIHTVLADGDKVVVEFEGNGKLINGDSYCNQYCMVFTMRDGRIAQVNEYFCTVLADKVLYPLAESAGL
ncbi:MAG TPA: nuclear transport factor 2 family protein [Porticoccaceae bacterium]